MVEYLSLLMFLAVCLLLMFGYPVALHSPAPRSHSLPAAYCPEPLTLPS